MNDIKRVTVFCGHYGSGKTNIAVNYALYLKKLGYDAALADIDIVNPYFRSKDSEKELREAGIEVVSLPFANSNVDLPSLPSAVYGLVQRRDKHVVMDVGGDDRGVYALGRYAPYILEENDFEMLCVVNFFRPLTRDADAAMEVMREIDAVCQIPFTGIVNNSNLGEETTAADVLGTMEEAKKLCAAAQKPLRFTSFDERLKEHFTGDGFFPLRLQKKI